MPVDRLAVLGLGVEVEREVAVSPRRPRQAELDRAERERTDLRETLLRIAGAMQFLRELDASLDDQLVNGRAATPDALGSDGDQSEETSSELKEGTSAVGTSG